MRCRHPNAIIKEEGRAWLEWALDNGRLPDKAYIPPADLTGTLWVRCFDCGLDRTYTPFGRMPKWLRRYKDQIYDSSSRPE